MALSVPENSSEMSHIVMNFMCGSLLAPPMVQCALAYTVLMIYVANNRGSLPRVLWVYADG